MGASADYFYTIQLESFIFVENLIIILDKSVILKGDIDCAYSVDAGITAIYGSIIVNRGIVIIENIPLK